VANKEISLSCKKLSDPHEVNAQAPPTRIFGFIGLEVLVVLVNSAIKSGRRFPVVKKWSYNMLQPL